MVGAQLRRRSQNDRGFSARGALFVPFAKVIIPALVGGLLAFLWASFRPPVYAATATALLLPAAVSGMVQLTADRLGVSAN